MSRDTAPDDVAESVRKVCLDAALEGYEEALVGGLCREGAWEAAISAMRRADLGRAAGSPAGAEAAADPSTATDRLEESVDPLARRFASPGPPAAGSGAAATGAIAAGLLEWIAIHAERRGPRSFRKRAGAIARRAVRLRRELAAAAERDAEIVERLIAAGRRGTPPEHAAESAEATESAESAESALAIASAAAQVATLIAELTAQVGDAFRLDARVALRLASSASQSAFDLFDENLRTEQTDVEWLREVQRQAWRARLLLARVAPLLANEGPDPADRAPS